MVVEDDERLRFAILAILKHEGMEAIGACDGAEALQLAEQRTPSAITLDLALPGVSGWSVLRALSTRPGLSAVPVLLVTAHLPDPGRIDFPQVAGVLSKPFRLAALVAQVRRLLPGPDEPAA